MYLYLNYVLGGRIPTVPGGAPPLLERGGGVAEGGVPAANSASSQAVQPVIHSVSHSVIRSFGHLVIQSFSQLFIHSFIYSFIHH